MRRIPRRPGRPVGPGPLPPGGAPPLPLPETPGRRDHRAVAAIAGQREPSTRRGGADDLPGIPVDAAIEAALAAPGIDPVTRVHLDEARGRLGLRRGEAGDGAGAPNLAETLFRFVMPRIEHPEVLGIERQRAILEQLASELAAADGDTVVREGALAVHRELRRIALLRQHCSSLVEG